MPFTPTGWGGAGGEEDIGRYRKRQEEATQTKAPGTDYGQANQDYASQREGMGMTKQGADMALSQAQGRGPSAAQAQLQAGQDSAMKQQMAMAASARGGPMQQAAAQRQAQQTGAQMQQQAANQSAQLRAQEQQAGMAMYGQMSGQYGQQATAARGQSAQQAQFGTQAELQQRGMNYGREGQYLGAETAARQGQLDWDKQQSQQAFEKEKNARDREASFIGDMAGALGSVAMFSDERLKTSVKPTATWYTPNQTTKADEDAFAKASNQSAWMQTPDGQRALDASGYKEPGSSRNDSIAMAKQEQEDERVRALLANDQERKRQDAADNKRGVAYGEEYDYAKKAQGLKETRSQELAQAKREEDERPTRYQFTDESDQEAQSRWKREEKQAAGGKSARRGLGGMLRVLSDVRMKDGATATYTSDKDAKKEAFRAGARAGIKVASEGPQFAQAGGTVATDQPNPREEHIALRRVVGAPAGAGAGARGQDIPATDEEEARRRATAGGFGHVAAIGGEGYAKPRVDYEQRGAGTFVQSPPAVSSDERGKEARGRGVDGMLRALAKSSATYKYKDPGDQPVEAPKGRDQRYAGVMAQDLERVPEIGKGLVTDTPKGKVVEGGAALSALMAAVGRQQQDIDRLKRKRA